MPDEQNRGYNPNKFALNSPNSYLVILKVVAKAEIKTNASIYYERMLIIVQAKI